MADDRGYLRCGVCMLSTFSACPVSASIIDDIDSSQAACADDLFQFESFRIMHDGPQMWFLRRSAWPLAAFH